MYRDNARFGPRRQNHLAVARVHASFTFAVQDLFVKISHGYRDNARFGARRQNHLAVTRVHASPTFAVQVPFRMALAWLANYVFLITAVDEM